MNGISGRIAFMKIREDRALQRIRRSIDQANDDRLLTIRDSQDAELDGLLRATGDAILVLEMPGNVTDDTLAMISDVMAGIAVRMPSGAGDVIAASQTAWKLLAVLDDELFLESIAARGRPGLLRTAGDVILALKSWLLVSEAVLDRLTWQSWVAGFLSQSDPGGADRSGAGHPDDTPPG